MLLFPLFAVVVFAFVQSLLWQHQRQLATAAADQASAAVAMYGADSGAARADAERKLTSAGMRDVSVSVSRGERETTVIIVGRAPGILIGTSSTIRARSVTPSEGVRGP